MRDQAVAVAGKGLDVAGRAGGVAQRFAQALDGGVEAPLEVDVGVGRPQPLAEFLAAHDLARASDEREEHPKRLLLEPHLHAVLPSSAAAQVEFERTDS